MIESNILGAAVGIQNQGVIDKTEGTNLPSTGDAVIAGKFKRGRMNKAFVVTRDNYKAMLGHDPSNPSYQAVEDVFARGVSQISIRRVGAPGNSNPSDGSGSGDGDGPPLFFCTPTNADINLYGSEPSPNIANGAHARYRINGGVWQVVEYYPIDLEAITANPEYKDYVKKLLVEPKLPVSLEVEPGESVTLNLPIIRYVGGEDLLLYSDVYDQIDATTPITSEKQILNAEINSRASEFYCNSLDRVAGWGGNFGVEMVEEKETKLEFVMSSGVGLDLVEAMFGGDVEILSCGRGRYAGGV